MRLISFIFFLISATSFSQWAQKGTDIIGESSDDLSGVSTAISEDGNTIIIGAQFNDGTASNAGHARVYEWDGSDWAQKGNDLNGEAGGDNFGISVDIADGGDVVAIGGYQNDGIGTDAGHLQVYSWNGSAWVQKGNDIEGQAAGDFTGLSCALSQDGNTLIVGDYYNDNTASFAGSARVFEWNGSAWVQKGITLNGEAFGDNYGFTADISDDANRIAIGSWANDEGGAGAGHTRVFEWSGTAWVQMGVDLDGDAAGDASGHAVRLNSDGSILAVGAIGNNDAGTDAGQVKIYNWSGSAWIQMGMDIDGASAANAWGHSVSLSDDGNTLIAGANLNDDNGMNAGEVRIFNWTGSAWTQKGQDLNGVAAGDWFGKSVDISADGSTAIVGATNNDQGGNDAGMVQVYYYCSGGLDTSVTVTMQSLTANGAGYTYQWLDCDNGYAALPGETNQIFAATVNGSYAVEVSDGICKDTSSCYQIGGIGLDEFENELYVYPNPATGVIYFNRFIQGEIFILDLTGNVVHSQTFSSNQLSIDHLSSGSYFLKINENHPVLFVIK